MAQQHNASIEQMLIAHLVNLATQQETTCYEKLAEHFDLPARGNALGATLSPLLSNVLHWCKKRGWPPLTVLVVRKSGQDRGMPGRGFWQEMQLGDPDYLARNERVLFTKFFTSQVYRYFED